jgi:hypothetical protein
MRKCVRHENRNVCLAAKLMTNIKKLAIRNRQNIDTSGATTPSCIFSGNQLVDQPKTTTA